MITKTGFSILAFVLAAGVALPQDKMDTKMDKKMSPAGSGILQPGMEPTGGWTSAGDMGDKADGWSTTSKAAGVDGKPLAGRQITLTGEIVDLSCYLQLGKHGDKHASCGKKCIANGEPIGLVTKAGQVYLLMAEEHDPRRDGGVGFRKAAGDNFAKVMTVTGTETTIGGVKSVYVQGYVGK